MEKVGDSADYQYYSFDPENSLLYHEVRDENFGDKESFIISLTYFITLIERFKPKRLIIKVYKKPDYFELELKNFMQKTLYETLSKVGTQKIAFYISDESYFSELGKYERDNSIKAKFFLDLELAKQWVLG
jgi:hypothetical protein